MDANPSQETTNSSTGTSRRKKRAGSTSPGSLVFQSEDGTALHASNLHRRSFQKIMERAGVSRIRFHDLRHTAATLMLGRGVHPKVVQERLGHRSIRLTLDTYSHVLPTMQQQAVAAVADLFNSLGSTTISPTSDNIIESSSAEHQQFQGFSERPSRKSA